MGNAPDLSSSMVPNS